MTNAIVVDQLSKVFRSGWAGRPSIHAISALSLSVTTGEIYGFLGPNGSGKTTTLKILLGLMRETSGRVEVLQKPAGDVDTRRRVGYLPEAPYFYDYLTAEEFLKFYGHLSGIPKVALEQRVTELLDLVDMTHARALQLRKFSKGMLQRVGLAQALIHDPELVILDEPMSGLDPVGRKQVRDIILGLRDQGKTVFFSSHIIPDVEMICDRVGVMMKGKLLASGGVDELINSSRVQSVEVVCEGIDPEVLSIPGQSGSKVIQRGSHALFVLPHSDQVDEFISEIRAKGGKLVSVIPQKGTLEDIFLRQANPMKSEEENPCGASVSLP